MSRPHPQVPSTGLDVAACRRFQDRAARVYGQHARVPGEVGDRLLERLDGLKFAPAVIADLGCGPGLQARRLAARFRAARVVAVDVSRPMLDVAGRQRGRLRRRFERIQGDLGALPLAAASVDLAFANLALDGCADPSAALNGLRRILRPGGLLLVSLFGRDTLRELHEAGAAFGDRRRVARFGDVQTLGNALIAAGFGEPVLDTDWITTGYESAGALFAELRGTGLTHAASDRPRGLMTPRRLRRLAEALEGMPPAGDRRGLDDDASAAAGVTVTWEIVYASAWAPDEGAPIRTPAGEQASVSVGSITRRRR